MLYDVGMYEVMTPNHLLFGRKLYQENPNWEMHEVMTPNHLLFGRKLYQENPNWESNSDIIEPDLPKRIEYVESLIEHFWKRWSFEYVTSLRECQKVSNQKIIYFRQKMILY